MINVTDESKKQKVRVRSKKRRVRQSLLGITIRTLVLASALLVLELCEGVAACLLLTVVVALTVGLGASAWELLPIRRHSAGLRPFKKLRVFIISLMLTLTVFEAFLQWQAASITWDPNHPPNNLIIPPLVLPKAWEARPVNSGADSATVWHTHLHIYDANQMRIGFKLPPRKEQVFRILTFGDSFTYGYGVPEHETYSAVLQKLLRDDYAVEVYNFGVYAYNSTDVLKEITRLVLHDQARSKPELLDPDLIIYGVCLNDYDTKDGQTDGGDSSLLGDTLQPFKLWLVERTYVGRFFEERIGDAMVGAGLRYSFTSAIDVDFARKKERFARDVKQMNQTVRDFGLPPVLAMVLMHEPKTDSRQHELATTTEQLLSNAGMTVVPTEAFVRKHSGQQMFVSRWERHPNAKAHRLFAEQLAETLQKMPLLDPYRRPDQ